MRYLLVSVLAFVTGCQSQSAPLAASAPAAVQTAQVQAAPSTDARKLIRKGRLQMRIKSYDTVRSRLERLVARVGGHVESSRVEYYGEGRVSLAVIELRIPQARFATTRQAIAKLGQVTGEATTAEDVSEAYADLAARLANGKRLEARLLQLVDGKTNNVKELLEVESALARVRESIEVYESKVRLYDSQISMSTLSLELYMEDSPIAVASLGSDVKSTLGGSWRALATFGRGMLLFGVGALPWLPLAAGLWFAQRYWRRRRRSPSQG